MATSRSTSKPSATAEKLTIVSRKGVIFLESVRVKQNKNGKDYIATPHGAVYARLSEVKPGLHAVVELSNGALAINDCTREERMQFINEKMTQFPNMSAQDIKDEFGL